MSGRLVGGLDERGWGLGKQQQRPEMKVEPKPGQTNEEPQVELADCKWNLKIPKEPKHTLDNINNAE